MRWSINLNPPNLVFLFYLFSSMFSVKLLSNGAPLHAFDSGEKNILPGSPSVPILRKDCFLNLEVYSNKKGEVRVWLEDVKELEGNETVPLMWIDEKMTQTQYREQKQSLKATYQTTELTKTIKERHLHNWSIHRFVITEGGDKESHLRFVRVVVEMSMEGKEGRVGEGGSGGENSLSYVKKKSVECVVGIKLGTKGKGKLLGRVWNEKGLGWESAKGRRLEDKCDVFSTFPSSSPTKKRTSSSSSLPPPPSKRAPLLSPFPLSQPHPAPSSFPSHSSPFPLSPPLPKRSLPFQVPFVPFSPSSSSTTGPSQPPSSPSTLSRLPRKDPSFSSTRRFPSYFPSNNNDPPFSRREGEGEREREREGEGNGKEKNWLDYFDQKKNLKNIYY